MTHEPRTLAISLRALLLCMVALALGCADGKGSKTESTASIKHDLVFPLTLTISTPNPVAPTAPVLVGSNVVRLGPRADVVSGMTVSMGTSGLTADADALLNETWSRGTAALRDRVRVRGTLHARTRTLGNGVVIDATDANPPIDPPSTLTWQVTYPSGPANNHTLNSADARALAPGKHGVVTLNSGSTLTLSTGIYYLTTLSVQSGATVKLDQANGPVVVYTTDNVTLRGSIAVLAGPAPPDLLIAHLGTSAVFVETLFNGAIVAPSASVTFRSVSGVHTGYFAAKEPILDAGARVTYRAPLALIRAATPPGATCRTLLAGLVPETEIFRYCGCPSPAVDTDRDRVEDCVDACPSDPLKTTEGKCGCGISDVDTDNDTVPDCLDQCDVDPNNVSPGECGCVRRPGEIEDLKPAGTACSDASCIQTGATCNGNGVCGNRNGCVIAPNCKLITNNGISYWFCPGPVTQSAATTACRARGTHLVRIDSISEGRFIQRFVTAPNWIGANSITTSGVWRWSTQTTNNGSQFWQGAVTGSQRNSLFSYWKPGTAPGSQRCAVLSPQDGRWVDVDCNQALGFVCEVPPQSLPPEADPLPTPTPPPPPQQPCVPLAQSRLPTQETAEGLEQLQADYNAAGQDPPVFQGAAANPPPDGSVTCLDDPSANAIGDYDAGAGCRLVQPTAAQGFECDTDDDCEQFGSGLFCRFIQDELGCEPDASHLDRNDPGAGCLGHARCGRIECAGGITSTCDQIEICGDPGSQADASLDPNTTIDSGVFDPAELFEQGLPDAGPSPAYFDPPDGSGRHHTWCFMNAQNPLPEARQPERDQQGAGKASNISFRFEPDLLFDANVNPLSLGETDLNVHASAQLVAGVKVENLFNSGIDFDKDILRAVADIQAQRCSVGNDETEFEVFGVDFISMDNKFIFNTEKKPVRFIIDPATNMPLDLTRQTKACNDAVGKFITFSNRAKKAFRDAQQLLDQFHTLKDAGRNLGTLCQDIMDLLGPTAPSIGFFPGGLTCPANEPPEITINRFLDYYQAPGFGQIQQLRDAIDNLVNQTNKIVEKLKLQRDITIADPRKSESVTIVNVPFFIGPVPMVLQVDAFYGYGVKGFFQIGIQFPFNPLKDEVGDDKPVASVKAGVMPYANAGLSAFVGAGTSLGGFSAALGIEGALTLAKLKAPIFAGAGISMAVTADKRPFEADIQSPVSLATEAIGLDKLTHFGIPTAVKFNVWYNYGAGIHVEDILKGEINATLRIKFFFFSRTWRKNVVRFNGFRFDADLLSGKSGSDPNVGVRASETLDSKNRDASTTNIVEGTTAMGVSEPQAPLAVLVALDPPDAAPDPNLVTPFDAGKVENLFYDNLCCIRPTDPPPALNEHMCLLSGDRPIPNGPGLCCPGFECFQPGVDLGTRCRVPPVPCKPAEADCMSSSECCSGMICTTDNTCQACRTQGGECGADSDCCTGIPCGPARGPANTCWVCRGDGEECSSDEDCCAAGIGDNRACNDPDSMGVRRCGIHVE